MPDIGGAHPMSGILFLRTVRLLTTPQPDFVVQLHLKSGYGKINLRVWFSSDG
jgi:hypothetical protein